MNTDNLFDACSGLVAELTKVYEGWGGVNQLKNTPNRLVRMYSDFCWSLDEIKVELDKHFKVFDNGFDEMLVTGPIDVWVLCPHHLLPCQFKVTIGYIPSGKVLGLSKFARIAEVMGRRPIMQEQYSIELADELDKRLQPKGVAVYCVGHHDCMRSRGIRQDAPVVTSIIKGVFEEAPTREEFFAIARRNF
jgi:GTP cyclohydrolase I